MVPYKHQFISFIKYIDKIIIDMIYDVLDAGYNKKIIMPNGEHNEKFIMRYRQLFSNYGLLEA
jgi:hypothetical protein